MSAKLPDALLKKIIEAHKRGEKVFISNVAIFPSDIFPIGSTHTMRMYEGRNQTSWGKLISETKAEVKKEGLTIQAWNINNAVNPATGQVKHMWISFWIVRPEGVEQYAGYQGEIVAGEPPSLDSLLTKGDYIN